MSKPPDYVLSKPPRSTLTMRIVITRRFRVRVWLATRVLKAMAWACSKLLNAELRWERFTAEPVKYEEGL